MTLPDECTKMVRWTNERTSFWGVVKQLRVLHDIDVSAFTHVDTNLRLHRANTRFMRAHLLLLDMLSDVVNWGSKP